MLATEEQAREVTQLLLAWNDGGESVLEKSVPLVYNEQRRLTQHRVWLGRPDHTLQAIALINETYLQVLKVSSETVRRDWRLAKVWLLRELSGGG